MELPYGYEINELCLSGTFDVYHHQSFLFNEPTAEAAFDRLVRYHAVMNLNALGEPDWVPQKSNQG
jgi:hypothetical protein